MTTLKCLMLGTLMALLCGATNATAMDIVSTGCQPAYVDRNGQPQVDTDCLLPVSSEAMTSCQPVYIDRNGQPQVDPDCLGSTSESASEEASSSTTVACQPVYIDRNGQPQVDPDCLGPVFANTP